MTRSFTSLPTRDKYLFFCMVLLYGIVFLGHQIGSFIGVWLGGWLYDTSGKYNVVWGLSVVLCIKAAIVHWPVNERPIRRLATQKV
jgi:predicted MFS family arabinose efflux permease